VKMAVGEPKIKTAEYAAHMRSLLLGEWTVISGHKFTRPDKSTDHLYIFIRVTRQNQKSQ